MPSTSTRLGARLRAVREQRGLSQDQLAELFGFNDRQTVSAIETGERRLSASELILAVQKLGIALDDLVDPFRLTGEGKFSWRQTNVTPRRLESFEAVAGRWIAAFREIAPQVGQQAPLLRRTLGLHKGSTFDEAMDAGERFAEEFKLGEVPAARLAEVMEHELSILVLMVDAAEGVSGAACRLPELDAVLINRKEVVGRRHFDLAHELFHLLTWDAMPPEHIEEATETGRGRVEQLANNFASALLMPRKVLERHGDWRGLERNEALIRRLKTVAHALQVTATALKWRLVALGHLPAKVARYIEDHLLRSGEGKISKADLPALFSRRFMEVLARAVEQGQVSVRRAADLVGLTLDDLSDLFGQHGVAAPFEL
jgi:Zn-dependent peptidase ImmA (M78 family)/transcriptional regulator with XRE-family HTH domain